MGRNEYGVRPYRTRNGAMYVQAVSFSLIGEKNWTSSCNFICNIYSTVGRSIADIWPRRYIYWSAKSRGKYVHQDRIYIEALDWPTVLHVVYSKVSTHLLSSGKEGRFLAEVGLTIGKNTSSANCRRWWPPWCKLQKVMTTMVVSKTWHTNTGLAVLMPNGRCRSFVL